MKILCLVAVLFAAETLQAQGILFVQEETRGGKTSTNQIQLDKTHIRAESHSSGESMAFVFDAASSTARVINTDKKTYMEIDGAQMQQMRQMMTQLQEQLKNMPPQQRAMMEQAMRGRGGIPGLSDAPAVALTYRQTGADKVGQWACTKYDGFRGADKASEVCTVDPKVFDLTAADFDVAKQLVEFLKSAMPQAADEVVFFGTGTDQGFSGIPVRQTRFVNGQVESVSEIKEFRRENFPASTFQVPVGFQRQGMPGR